jgi:hypothetical protein
VRFVVHRSPPSEPYVKGVLPVVSRLERANLPIVPIVYIKSMKLRPLSINTTAGVLPVVRIEHFSGWVSIKLRELLWVAYLVLLGMRLEDGVLLSSTACS